MQAGLNSKRLRAQLPSKNVQLSRDNDSAEAIEGLAACSS